MSFIELGTDLNDIKEPSIMPEGMYNLVIVNVKETKKGDNKGLLVVVAFQDELDAANILHNISLPTEEDIKEKRDFKLLFIKKFCTKFGIVSVNGRIDLTLFPGSTGKCGVTLAEYQGIISNKLKL